MIFPTVAEISFEQSVYTFVEDISSGRQLFVGITDPNIQLPPDDDFFISVTAAIHPSTNATRGTVVYIFVRQSQFFVNVFPRC